MDGGGTLERLVNAVGTALAALSEELVPDRLPQFFLELGLDDALDLSGDPLFQQKLAGGVLALEGLLPKLDALSDAFAAGDAELSVRAGADVLATVKAAVTALGSVATDLKRAASSTPLASSAASLSTELVERLLEYALVCHLERTHPVILAVLEFLSVVDRTVSETGSGETARTVLRRRTHFDRLPLLVKDPPSLLQTGYGWGTETLQWDLFLWRLGQLLLAVDILTGNALDDDGQPILGLDLFGLTVGPQTDRHPPGLAATLTASAADSPTLPFFSPSPEWHLELGLTGAFREGLTLLLLPPARLELAGPFAPAPGGVRFQLRGEAADDSSPFVPLGVAGGSRIEAKKVEASVGGSFSSSGSADVTFELDVTGGGMVLTFKGADGFLSQVLPEELRLDFDFGLTWSSERGFSFRGSAGLDATLPVGISIGALKVPTIHLGLQAGDAGLQVEVSASVALSIGPVQVLVDRIGLLTVLTFPKGGGNLGPVDLSLGFKPPSGAGLVIDSAGVSGGGFLKFEPEKHEYSGVLQLEYTELALQAFGLITTQVAGGQGYSLLALIDADFPPIQLGWGFTLDGVGGLLAIHRTASVDALRAALKADTLSTILFPKNAIANAPQILAALDAYFPTAPGRFLFGPMALIGWGTPTVLTAAIAVVVELPEPIRILLLARVEARFPSPAAPLVRINMDALGVLDLGQSALSFDATLYDSRLLTYVISGDMALRATWAGQREFLLAIGGFHPRFTPPAGFPALQRIAINMPGGAVSKLRLAAYLAITSNTVQFGAELDVFIGVAGFGLAGQLGFDALLQLDPFHFDADISGSVALTAGGDDLMSVELDATLSGPAPWNIAGKFKVHFLFFTLHKDFSHSWGEDAPALNTAAVDVGNLLGTALADPRSWAAQLPAGAPAQVSVRQIEDPSKVLAHPLARLEVHERIVPLGLDITRFGGAAPAGATRFGVDGLRVGAGAVPSDPVQDDFAPAQFFDLSDEEKLARPSYERHDAGLRLGAVPVASGSPVAKDIAYETFYVDEPGGPQRTDAPAGFWLIDLLAILEVGAAGRAASTRTANRRYQSPGSPIVVQEPAFVVVDADTLAPIGPAAVYSNAQALLNGELARAPGRRGALQIVATHEMAGA